ncbi:pyridoxamine 5'-phosphate oxidase [Malassezia restricta]|uniref:pyridoxamine 5'-phosphate oxidase n=1 Tax=Malassezia restricta TaxID=76775 RepID=UPI000DD10AAC|nr:pyridoxamine 5'-phosphate oxidase [Malassezia restricta]AXA48085.1 pyridoxamine 5'-phosphate oxidase [Malassezia restricta]
MWKSRLKNALATHANDWSIGMYAFATMHKHKMQSELEPRVRYVIHRGFVNETNDPESECLIFTTDVRSGKASDIAMRPSAPVEIAWYISQERIQFRIRGSAHVLSAPTHEWRLGFPAAQLEQRGTRLDWDQERERIWRTLSPKMRGSFFGPTPGKPLTSSEIQPPVESVENIPESFALVIIEPHHVDMLDLKSAQRTLYERHTSGVWESQLVAP